MISTKLNETIKGYEGQIKGRNSTISKSYNFSADLDLLKLIEWGNVDNLSLKGQKGQVLVKFEICLAGCE